MFWFLFPTMYVTMRFELWNAQILVGEFDNSDRVRSVLQQI